MSTVVLVPGACHGGWWYQPLVARIEQSEHAARAVTLAGLEDEPQLNKLITLRTHIDQVADEIPAGGDVVLVGHSYAGSVITGVADRLPTRIAALVYLDAFLPEDGDSCWSMTSAEQHDWYVNGSVGECGRTGAEPVVADRRSPRGRRTPKACTSGIPRLDPLAVRLDPQAEPKLRRHPGRAVAAARIGMYPLDQFQQLLIPGFPCRFRPAGAVSGTYKAHLS